MSEIKTTDGAKVKVETKADEKKSTGETPTPADTLKAQQDLIRQRHEQERRDMEKRQKAELTAVDPNILEVDEEAYDATRPREVEAPYQTLAPSMRQYQHIAYAQEQKSNVIEVPRNGLEESEAKARAT